MTASHPALAQGFASCVPRPQGRPRWDSARRRTFTDAPTERAVAELAALLLACTPRAPLSGPLLVTLTFCMPIPKKPLPEQFEAAPHVFRPDVDNLSKLVLDVLSRLGWWADDAQVSTLTARKVYSARPGVHVRVDQDEGL